MNEEFQSEGAGEIPGISFVIPAYNEGECIESTLLELTAALDRQPWGVEILVVDDGSTDRTPDILVRLARQHPRLRVFRIEPNSGQSAAFGVGFRHAAHPVVVTLDADGQNDPASIADVVRGLDGADVCCGYRSRRADSWSRRMASRIGNRVRDALLGDGIIDTGCSLKAFRTEWVRDLPMWAGMHRFLPALCAMRGARIAQVPVLHRPRMGGTSKYTNWGRLRMTVADLMAVRWMQRRTRRFESREMIT